MKQSKITHYKISITQRFLAGHRRAGEPTNFKDQIMLDRAFGNGKIHTIRQNYPLWVKRINKVHEGKAVIDLCEWKLPGGRFTPGNELIPFATLDKDSGCGVQELQWKKMVQVAKDRAFVWLNKVSRSAEVYTPIVDNKANLTILTIANNDGLTSNDFKSWFKSYDLTQPMAIIHFTAFRY